MFLALVLFVGIPVLGTGAWTGILASSILELDFKESIGACFCGVLLAVKVADEKKEELKNLMANLMHREV